MHWLTLRQWSAALVIGALAVAAPAIRSTSQETQPPPDIRATIEGTWELIEWHVDGVIVTPPEMEGRWMVHDGFVMAIRHRDGPESFVSTAGYGEYVWGPMTWTYGYERSEDLAGTTSADPVTLSVTGANPIPMRTFDIRREGTHLLLEQRGGGLTWDYDMLRNTFLLMAADGTTIRKYRRVR